MAITTEDVVKAITFTTRMSPSVSESGDIVIDDARLPIESISADALKTVIATVSSYDELGELSVVTKTSYEVLVQGDRHLIVARGNEFSLDDSQAGLTYRLGYGSNSYVVFLALKAHRAKRRAPATPLYSLAAHAHERQ